jgi:hypothetical protein
MTTIKTQSIKDARVAMRDLDDQFGTIEGAICALDIIAGNMNDEKDGEAIYFVTNGIRAAIKAARDNHAAATAALTTPNLEAVA